MLKDALLNLKAEAFVILRFSELRQRLRVMLPDDAFTDSELRAVLGLMAGQGVIRALPFGDFTLFCPEILNNYAALVVNIAREHPDEIGCVAEDDVLTGRLDFKDLERVTDKEDERVLFRCLVTMLVENNLCIREQTAHGTMLVFPSQFRRDMPQLDRRPFVVVAYEFFGNSTTIYTSLVVRLWYSGFLQKGYLWNDSAEFETSTAQRVVVMLERIEGGGKLSICIDRHVDDDTKITIIKYAHEHLMRHSNKVHRYRFYVCPECERPVVDHEAVEYRIRQGGKHIRCLYCEFHIPLNDLIEMQFNDDRFLTAVKRLESNAGINLDNESKELVLVGHAYAVAAEAGQIFRQVSNSDWGIDGEIEFKDIKQCATGRRVYLQLKSGDSHLRRLRDGNEVFTVKNQRLLEYWRDADNPVFLVVRRSAGAIEWMNITAQLRSQEKNARTIPFDALPFNASSVLKLRDVVLGMSRRKSKDKGKLRSKVSV